jgi:hypothetical protein
MAIHLIDAYSDPLSPEIETAADRQATQASVVSGLIDRAMDRPPLPGTVGRLELLRHWEGLPSDKRELLLLFAREMSVNERPGAGSH